MLRRLTLLVLLAAALAPAPAAAQIGPLPFQTQETTPEPRATPAEEDDGLERWQQLLIFGGGVMFIGLIGFVIVRDAKRRAPVDDERSYYRHKAEDRQAKRKVDRKKTKAQKAARKRQRARR